MLHLKLRKKIYQIEVVNENGGPAVALASIVNVDVVVVVDSREFLFDEQHQLFLYFCYVFF